MLKKIDGRTALEFAEVISKAIGTMETLSIKNFEKEVVEFACRNNLTIYDASYIYTAIKYDFELITDDEKIVKIAFNYVGVLKSYEL